MLAVIPASCRLDLHLVGDALGDDQARLAARRSWPATSPATSWRPAPLGALVGSQVFLDPKVLEHDLVGLAAGTQTESVRMRTRELFASEQITPVPLIRQADWAATT